MPNLNSCTFIGHVGRDAEVANVGSSGKAVLKFSLAVQSGYGQNKKTTWVNVTKWEPPPWMREAITRGSVVCVCGEIELREYDARDGSKKQSLDLRAQNVIPWAPKDEQPASRPRQAAAPSFANDHGEITDDDIPF